MKPQPPRARKLPAQQRSKLLVDAIVQACQQVLETEGSEQLSTNRIAEVAGITIGSLYQYFPNKEAILTDLFTQKVAAESEHIASEATARVAAKSQLSLRATLAEIIAVQAESHLRFVELHGDFYREYHSFFDFRGQVDARVTAEHQQPSWQQWFPQLLQQYRSEIEADDIEMAAFVVGNMIDGLLSAALEQHSEWLADKNYLQQIENAAINYLCNNTSS